MSNQNGNTRGCKRPNKGNVFTESSPAYTGKKYSSSNEKAINRPTPASSDKTKK